MRLSLTGLTIPGEESFETRNAAIHATRLVAGGGVTRADRVQRVVRRR